MSKPKTTKSLENSRKELLVQMTSRAKGGMQEKVIRFPNDDVPNFLRNLEDFEEKSRNTCINIK